MRILVATPGPPRARTGNGVTAARWAGILRSLGHRVVVTREYRGQPCDLLVALHARKSFGSIDRFRRERAHAPVIVALTGTDLYDDLPRSADARRSLELASRLVVLQPLGIRSLPPSARPKARAIVQSAIAPRGRARRRRDVFEVCVLAHLRPVKDPLLAARAASLLPASSRLRVVHLGAPLDSRMERLARAETMGNPRYSWRGSLPRARALRVLARSRLLVVTSRIEGGANVVSEALACSVPVLSSRIPGSVGILGSAYAGYFRPGDTGALARLLGRAETDPAFYSGLADWCRRLRPLVAPARERAAWRRLLAGLVPAARRTAAPPAGPRNRQAR